MTKAKLIRCGATAKSRCFGRDMCGSIATRRVLLGNHWVYSCDRAHLQYAHLSEHWQRFDQFAKSESTSSDSKS